MIIKRFLLLFAGIFMLAQNSYAQKKEFKFGNITELDFNAKPFGVDSAAAAVKIFDVGDCYFEYNNQNGFIFIFERHVRYKIINKNAYDLADFSIPLYQSSNSSKEDLLRMEAATYNIEGGKQQVSKLNKDSKFTETFNKNYQIKKYTLANIKEGSVIEYKYKISSPFIFNLRGWEFQAEVPTIYSAYNVTIPEYLIYKPEFGGMYRIQTKSQVINAHYVTDLASNANYTKYSLSNIPALVKESFITTMDDYNTSIGFELMATRYPNELYKDYTGNWPKIIKGLSEDENFGSFINKSSAAKTLLPTILKGETDTQKIVSLIYDYVKNNIKWDERYRMYASVTNPKQVLEKKVGTTGDINLTLLSLLKEAKIDAKPVLISTRSNGLHPGYPQISKFNSVLIYVKIADKELMLDATNRDHDLGMVSYESLNHQGFLVDLKTSNGSWKKLEPTFIGEKAFVYTLMLDEGHTLKGSISQYHKGYSALAIRSKYRSYANQQEYVTAFKKDKQGLSVDDYKLINLDNYDDILTEQITATIEDNVEEAGNLVYLNPFLYEQTKENYFKSETRTFPVDFAYPLKETARISITFPDTYTIEKLPKGGVFKLPDNKGSFSVNFITDNNVILVKSAVEINRAVFSPEEYFDIKELFKVIVERQAEQIVFKKKS